MDKVPYSLLFPKEAEQEARTLRCHDHPLLPDHPFRVVEHFCVEPACDCRVVGIWILDEETLEVPAILEHTLRFPVDARKYSRTALDPKTAVGIQDIDPMVPPDPTVAVALMAEFHRMVAEDPSYDERLIRIHEEWRQAVDDPAHRLHPLIRSYWASTGRARPDRRREPRFDYLDMECTR